MSMMGELKFFIGIQINQCKDKVYVHQSKYTKELLKKFNLLSNQSMQSWSICSSIQIWSKELLKKFNLLDCKLMTTHMNPTWYLSKDDNNNKLYQKVYRGMIGSFLYLISSWPGILFDVFLCAHFHSYPRETRLSDVMRIIRYLKGTTIIFHLLYTKSQVTS